MPETSRSPKRRSRWFAALTFAALAAAVVGFQQYREHQRRQRMPKTLTELAKLIKEKHPEWEIISNRNNRSIAEGFYLTIDSNIKPLRLKKLIRSEKFTHLWKEIVVCEMLGTDPDYGYLNKLGENCLICSPFLFFGDIKLINQIRLEFMR